MKSATARNSRKKTTIIDLFTCFLFKQATGKGNFCTQILSHEKRHRKGDEKGNYTKFKEKDHNNCTWREFGYQITPWFFSISTPIKAYTPHIWYLRSLVEELVSRYVWCLLSTLLLACDIFWFKGSKPDISLYIIL